jgi:2-haloacid dehalogenase
MTTSRREFLAIVGTTAASSALGSAARGQPARARIRAVGFDAFTIFDPGTVTAALKESFPDRAEALSAAWRTRQFEYCWLRTLNQRYVDFWQVTDDALAFTFKAAKIDLTAPIRDRLMDAFLELKPWPDSLAALQALRDAGIRLAHVSNFSPRMLKTITDKAGASALFEHQLSTDAVAAFKPDPRAYQMAEKAFGLPREAIAFAAFGGWDAAGAKSFGLETFWVNRLGAPLEELGVTPDATGRTLSDFAAYLLA